MTNRYIRRATPLTADVLKDVERLRQVIRSDMQREADEGAAALARILDETLTRMPSAIFERDYLRVFSGEIKDEAILRQSIINWIAMAGSPMREVAIVDESGQVLFKVPAMFDSSHYDGQSPYARGTVMNVADVMHQVKHMHESGMSMQATMLTTRHHNRLVKTPQVSAFQARIDAWNKIFKHYGKPLILTPEQRQQAASAPIQEQAQSQEQITPESDKKWDDFEEI